MAEVLRFTVEVTGAEAIAQVTAAVEASGQSRRAWTLAAVMAAVKTEPRVTSRNLNLQAALQTALDNEGAPPPSPRDPEPRGPRTEEQMKADYLTELSKVYGQDLAAVKAEVPLEMADRWFFVPEPPLAGKAETAKNRAQRLAAETFIRLAQRARNLYIEEAQDFLVAIGKGARGNAQALGTFLGAVHPDFGLVRQRFVKKILDATIGKLKLALKQEFQGNKAGRESLKRVVQRLEEIVSEEVNKLPE